MTDQNYIRRLPAPAPVSKQVWPEGTTPTVSVCCLAYNHENFIRDCLNGFLMQETSFPIEVLVHDDASTDRTASIIREYEERYPNEIKPIYQEENQWSKGIRPTVEFNFPRAKGKYIAMCEGDDYWTDPLKLQKQVDFLEKNKDFAITHHKTDLLKDGKIQPDYLNSNTPEITTICDLAKGNYIRTLSMVFRNPQYEGFFSKFPNTPIGDFPLSLAILDHFQAKVRYFPQIMGTYRVHQGGIHECQSEECKILNTAITIENLINSSIIKNKDAVCLLEEFHNKLFLRLYKTSNDKKKKMEYLKNSVKYSDKEIQNMINEINELKNNFPYKIYRHLSKIFTIIKKILI